MAKKEKKSKQEKKAEKLAKKAKKQAPLIPEHQRPLICPPDRAGRGLATRVFGYVCRCLVVACLIWALMMFFGGGLAHSSTGDPTSNPDVLFVGVSDFTMLLLAVFATAVFGLLWFNRYTALGGIALGAAGIALMLPNVVQGALALYNGFLCRLYISKFTLYLTTIGIDVPPNMTAAADLAKYYNDLLAQYGEDGMLVMALVLAAIFVPLLAKRTRPVLPAIACLVVIVPVCVFNTATSGLGAGMLMASVAAVLVMWAYDKMFRRRVNADKYDTKLQLFVEEGKPQYPEEYLQKLREKAEKKEQKKLARAAKKQKRTKDKTVDQEISDYFKTSQKKAKPKKQRLTEQEKKELKAQKKAQRLHQKEVRRQVRKVRRYEQQTDSAKSAMGGFAAAMMLAVCFLIVIVPSLLIREHMVIQVLDEKIRYARAYVTAALMGDDERLDELEYELEDDNFKPHSTTAEHREFDGTQLFRIESRHAVNLYLRGWIGVDYHDGAWYTGQASKDEENRSVFDVYRDLYSTKEFPSDQMFYDFYWLTHPELVVFDPEYDFLNKSHKYSDYGFIAMTVHMRRINSYSSLVYLPTVHVPGYELRGFGNTEPSEHTFINYFDGILTGRDFVKNGTQYSAVTFAPIKTGKYWISTLSADISDYNLQKELILAFNSYRVEPGSYTDKVYTYYKIDAEEDYPAPGLTTLTYKKGKNVVASFVHESDRVQYSSLDKTWTLYDSKGNAYVMTLDDAFKIESVTTEYNDSLFGRYLSGKDSDKREIDRILFGGDAEDALDIMDYSEYVYNYYTGKSESEIIAEIAQQIRENATHEVKDEISGEKSEVPYDFTYAAVQGATFDQATAQRNDLVRAVIDYIIYDLECEYTLKPDLEIVDPTLDGVENFLTVTKQGYCVQYASAACLILREYGIPARYVEGYIACEFSNSTAGANLEGHRWCFVRDYAAHAWIEVFFDGIGWVQYECTPAYYEGMYGGATTGGNTPSDNDAVKPPPSIQEEIQDIISGEDEPEDEDKDEQLEEEQMRQAVIATVVVVSIAAVVGAVIWLLIHLRNRAASAEYKRSSVTNTVLSDHFGENTGEDDRREMSYALIDALHNILDIYGLSPETGEFKDEYARRVASDLEDILGRSPEYEQPDPDPDPNAPAPLPISPYRMGEIMDSIAAEEFGHGMSIAQMKQIAALYRDLHKQVNKRVSFGRRFALRYFKNRL